MLRSRTPSSGRAHGLSSPNAAPSDPQHVLIGYALMTLPSPELPSNGLRPGQVSGLRHVLTDSALALPEVVRRPLEQMPPTAASRDLAYTRALAAARRQPRRRASRPLHRLPPPIPALAQARLRLVTRRAKKDDQVDQRKGKSVRIIIDGKDNYQFDGDVVGESTTLFAEIQPGALAICVPAQTAREPQL
jgi:hypothetical protein